MEEKHLIANIPQKAIIDIGGKVLLVRNSEAHWQLPGGRINERESPQERIVREIKEELDADVDPMCVLTRLFFRARAASGIMWDGYKQILKKYFNENGHGK